MGLSWAVVVSSQIVRVLRTEHTDMRFGCVEPVHFGPMDRTMVFDHFYDQYKEQATVADYLYRRAALWLTADGLIATAFTALATGDPTLRFGVNITEPTAAVVGILTAGAIAFAFMCMGLALFPRAYGQFSLPHEILAFRTMYRTDLEKAGYPKEHREAVESETMFDELAKVLAEKTKRNAELNEARHRMLGKSSVLTFIAVCGLMILLTSAVVSTARTQAQVIPSGQGTSIMPNENTRESIEPPPPPPPPVPPASETQIRGDHGVSRPPAPAPSAPPPSGIMTKGG